MKFKYYNNEGSEFAKGVIDFNKVHATVQKHMRKGFRLHINQGEKTFYFKAANTEIRDEWFECFSQVISRVSANLFDIKFNSKYFWRKDSITAKEFIDTADSGDILLFRKHSFLPKMQRTITSSEYDHVGMIVITEDQGERKCLLLESVYYDDGVRLVDLSDPESFKVLLRSHIKLVYRKLMGVDKSDDFIDDLGEGLGKVLNKKYGINFFNFWRRSGQLEVSDKRSFHCAELVAKMYKLLGLINNPKGSSRYLPDTFSQHRKLKLARGYLGPEQIVCFSDSDSAYSK